MVVDDDYMGWWGASICEHGSPKGGWFGGYYDYSSIKDALNDAVYSIFGANLTKKADTKIILSISSSSLDPLDYDENGFPILYRSAVILKAKVIDKYGKIHNYTVKGNYDFAISPNSIINDQLKFNSFKQASVNALNILLAEITKDGAMYDN